MKLTLFTGGDEVFAQCSKIDWSMDGVEWLDGVGVAGVVDRSLNVVNMSSSALVVIRPKSGEHAVAVVYRLIRK